MMTEKDQSSIQVLLDGQWFLYQKLQEAIMHTFCSTTKSEYIRHAGVADKRKAELVFI